MTTNFKCGDVVILPDSFKCGCALAHGNTASFRRMVSATSAEVFSCRGSIGIALDALTEKSD